MARRSPVNSLIKKGVNCLRQFSLAVAGGGLLAWAALASPSDAAERVVFKYRWMQRAIPVEDLSVFAETGESSQQLEHYLDALGDDADTFQRVLTRQIQIDPRLLDRGLNHPLGHLALDQISPIFHTASGESDRQALRAALVLSASDDEHISIIELLETYPTQEIHVEGDRLVEAYDDIERLRDRLERWTAWL
ncbi:MAG: alpha/beta hydrolase [Leptolyngbyaceae bacterium]|nr:alpha/beta hydrolase [Leptolyngbyaceae bacterium]